MSGASVEAMTDKPELNWAQLNELTNEVRGDSGPGTEGWRAEGSHTRRFNEAFIEEFRRNAGKIPGELGEVDLLLLTVKGAKSGKPRTVPVGFHRIDGRLLVIASMGGADRNPPWFYNVVANPEVTVELGTEVFRARAVVTEGEDHDRLFAAVVARMPVFAEYRERTDRVIPVIELQQLPEQETS
jgi:deazaflavin-dependent oxidoreductase (nitroreductase family)